MQKTDYWSTKTNPDTGEKFESELSYLRVAHNGYADIDAFIDSEYGEAYAKLLELRFKYEEAPMGEAVLAYYRSLGLKKEMFEDEDYYTRWALITPLEMDEEGKAGKKYPLVFVNHGGFNSIEQEEFGCGMPHVAAKEKIMVAYLQNTNWENTERVLNIIAGKYPLDTERVYMTGYSQGGYQVTSSYFRIPERFAAVAPCGNDIYRDYDNFNVPFTKEETEHLKETFVPFMQIVGTCEASSFAPVNDWQPRKNWGKERDAEPYTDPRRDDMRDPTRVIGGKRRFSDMPEPPEGVDKHEWMIDRLNKRMYTLGCEPRDAKTCISYLNTPEDELHHVLGFYGDAESIHLYHGYKHYTLDIWNKAGVHAFRYVAVENAPHCWPVMTGQLVWDFFKQFRRDRETGNIVMIPERPEVESTTSG
ncbi:hypothetical protein [Paenibacillus thalictri]|uniref:Uncharacterized protein n=1 Tax=Paenibacillus thalictri TaxID=2527873 RepID=A0A4Q9DN87_9BACL|nr:hypothetical protein [Paenibacillus thalictri]TBL76324.1 hypothetical protein EYB31_20230 [Paenibacillus thalictri]